MSDEARFDEILEALHAAGLTETYLDEDGQEAMRLTSEGAALARDLGILEHGPGPEAPMAGGSGEPTPTQPLDLTHSWGTAAGAAMLGFEQALRSEPPPETVAGEHVPERGLSGADEGIVLMFPDEIEQRDR